MSDIGERNAKFALDYLKRESIRVLAEDLGHEEPCKIYFFAQTGRVLLKRLKSLRNDTIVQRERDYAQRLERRWSLHTCSSDHLNGKCGSFWLFFSGRNHAPSTCWGVVYRP